MRLGRAAGPVRTSPAGDGAQRVFGDVPEVQGLSAGGPVATADSTGVHLLRGADPQVAADALKGETRSGVEGAWSEPGRGSRGGTAGVGRVAIN